MSSINSRTPPLRLAAVDSPSDGEVAAYQASSGQFEWVANGSGGSTPGGSSGSIQYNDGAGGFAGSSKMVYDDTDAKITLTTGGNTLFIDAGGSPQLSFDGTGTGNIPTIAGDGGETGGTGLLLLGNGSVSNNYIWFNKSADQIQLIAPSVSESIYINSNLGGNIEITTTGGSQDVILSAASGNVKIEGLSYPSTDGTVDQVLKTDGAGVLSFTDAATGTVTGTGSANQVSYWTSTTAQAGSTGLTYDPSTGNLTVGGYVETGTKITTPSGTNLELSPGGASSGSIIIADGANGQISINPNGTGTVKIDGVEIDNSAIATGYVLKATSTTAAGWSAESGGGITFPIEADSGSAGVPSYSFSADTDTGIYLAGASNLGIAAGGSSYLSIGSLGAVQLNRKALFNAATAAAPNGFATDTNTGFFQPSADTIGFSTGGTERLRFGSSGEILVGGTASGTSGQVLTSGGSGAAVSWTTVSGGSALVTFEFPASDSLWSLPSEHLGAGNQVYGGSVAQTQWANGTTRIRPHFIQQAGTLDKARIWLSAAPTGGEDQIFTLALWNADANGGVGTLKCQSTFTIGTGASAGILETGWVAETGESLSVDIGDLYWVGFYSNYASGSTAATFYWIRADSINSVARRDNGNTGYSSSSIRFYSSTSGTPSTLGDNPTINKADGASSSSQGVWPFIWYTVT